MSYKVLIYVLLFAPQAFSSKVKDYQLTAESFFAESQEIVDVGHLDKTDIDGAEKTTNALSQRWNAVNKHVTERRER